MPATPVFLRRWMLTGVAFALASAAFTAGAQAYPSRPIRLIAPSTAGGGGVDLYARLIGKKLTDAWGQQVIVDNRPGGGMSLGATVVAKAVPEDRKSTRLNSSH